MVCYGRLVRMYILSLLFSLWLFLSSLSLEKLISIYFWPLRHFTNKLTQQLHYNFRENPIFFYSCRTLIDVVNSLQGVLIFFVMVVLRQRRCPEWLQLTNEDDEKFKNYYINNLQHVVVSSKASYLDVWRRAAAK